ncbi:hypothetical protein GQ457_09G006600 [Hibiscus cannabinus]
MCLSIELVWSTGNKCWVPAIAIMIPVDHIVTILKVVLPISGSVKFNTDDVVAGSFGMGVIEGCLCNGKGKILIYFSKSVGFTNPTSIELLAIFEACRLLSNSIWSHSMSLTLEFDSKLTVEWLTQPHKAPKYLAYSWDFNLTAHRLAKKGISRGVDLVFFDPG